MPGVSRASAAIDAGQGPRYASRMHQHARERAAVVALTFAFVLLTKLVSVPMRLAGAVISIVPVAGNAVNDAIGQAANAVDDVPI